MMVHSNLAARTIPSGLGVIFGNTQDTALLCSGPSYWVNPITCSWLSMSQADWQGIVQGVNNPPTPPGAIPAAVVSGPNSNPACAGMTQDQCNALVTQQVNDALNQAMAQTQANTLENVQQNVANLPTDICSNSVGISCTTLLLIGAGTVAAIVWLGKR